MPSIHPVRAWIAITTEEWERFRALATVASSDASHTLATLVRSELARQGVQLRIDDPPAKAKPAARRKRKQPASSPASSPARKRRRTRGLPVVSDAVVAAEARRGAKAARKPRSRSRGTTAVEGADQHDAVIAKANTRSRAGGKGRPTRRRSS